MLLPGKLQVRIFFHWKPKQLFLPNLPHDFFFVQWIQCKETLQVKECSSNYDKLSEIDHAGTAVLYVGAWVKWNITKVSYKLTILIAKPVKHFT